MLNATTAVLMTVTMYLPDGAHLKQAWQTQKVTTLDICLQMNEVFAQGGKAAVATVRCERIK